MNSRRQDLLKRLSEGDSWIKGKNLATLLDVSDRTIRTDVDEINKKYPGIIESSTREGYRINVEKYNVIKGSMVEIPQTPEDRAMYIIKQLLFHKNNLSFYELQEKLYVSEHTIEGDIKRVRTILKPYSGIRLVRERNHIFFDGSEQVKRRLYRDLLSNEIHGNFLNLDRIAALYEKFDLLKIVDILETVLQNHNYSFRETSIPMIIIHVGITIERILNGNYLDDRNIELGSEYQKELEIASELFDRITKHVPIEYREEEVLAIARLLVGYKSAIIPDTEYNLNGKNISVTGLLNEISEQLDDLFDLDFSKDNDFQNGLHLHLQSLFGRLEKNASIPNAHLNEIKSKYPLVFEMGLHVTRIIENYVDIDVSESEVGFIALHIGAAYDRLTMKYRHRVLLITPNNQSFVKMTVDKIRSVFGERLEIVDVQSYLLESTINQHGIEMILTHSHLEHSFDIPTVQISMFVNSEDESKIFVALNELDKRRFNLIFAKHFGKLIKEDYFTTDLDLSDPTEIIHYMSQKLVKDKYVSETFTQSVLDREKMSSTSFDYSIAIPHPLNMESCESVISIATLKKPVKWGSFTVRLVILLAITEEDSATMWLFFDWLSESITNAEKMNRLIESKNRDEFVHWMTND